MLLLLGLSGGANSTLLVSSINILLTYLQVNSSLLLTSSDTIAYIFQIQFSCLVFKKFVVFLNQTGLSIQVYLNASIRN